MQTQPSEMVARVARALAIAAGSKIAGAGQSVATGEFRWEGDAGHLGRYVEAHWRDHINGARAAIAAMREPTEAMSAAGMRGLYGGYRQGNERVLELWRAMIDEAMGA